MKKIREGGEYIFTVEKELWDGERPDLYMLKGPDGTKYLLSAANYLHYGIKKGMELKCRVDRINCKGEVFLEPENPYYKEGKIYSFPVVSHDIRTDISGEEVKVMLVQDIFKKLIPVPCDPLPQAGSTADLLVERISKGKLHLAFRHSGRINGSLAAGRKYEFRVLRTARGLDDEEYFVISDPAGGIHTLSRAHYEHYGIKPGTLIRGRVVKNTRSGEKIIEPDNPYYKPGQFISLKMTGYSKNPVNDSFTLDLEDKFGFVHCIPSSTLPAREQLLGRVKMIRKGKPLLILL